MISSNGTRVLDLTLESLESLVRALEFLVTKADIFILGRHASEKEERNLPMPRTRR